jgi:hypothetical protein
MTAWQEFSRADFDSSLAPKYVRQNSAAGQEQLFNAGTPVAATAKRRAATAQQLDGQGAMFGTDSNEEE